jgi:hypothetical protein
MQSRLPKHPRNKPTPKTALTPAAYLSELQLLSTEIEAAIIIFHTYEEVNRLAVHDPVIFKALNKDALFWRTQMHCLQTSLFITLSRIFDIEANAHTIHTVVNATLDNIDLFSVAALGLRKLNGGPKPWWFDEYLAKAWIPASAKCLRHLKAALKPHTRYFREVYLPIRHAIFAHRLMSDDQASAQLFGGASRDKVATILDFLHDLIETIRNLYDNGRVPKLGQKDFSEHNQRIRDGVAKVLRNLC